MPPLAIPFKLRAKLYQNTAKDYWAAYRSPETEVWVAELTQRAYGLHRLAQVPVYIEAATRSEAATKAREAFAKRDIQVIIR